MELNKIYTTCEVCTWVLLARVHWGYIVSEPHLRSLSMLTMLCCRDCCSQWEGRVVLGEHDLRRASGLEQNIAVSRVYVHPRWNPSMLCAGYDCAFLPLDS